MALEGLATAGLNSLKAGFALAVPASEALKRHIADSILVHRVSVDIARQHVIQGPAADQTGFPNAMIWLTGKTGDGLLHLLRATVRDHRVFDPSVFQGTADRDFTDFVYFFLGEPEDWQVKAQNYGGDGEFLTIRIRGRDLLAEPRRKIFYRRGLFWEADRAVVVKGGYEGLARVTPMPAG